MPILNIHNKYKNKSINYNEAEQLLHSIKRNERFELFIALYHATLKNNPIIAYEVFREAYCSSDNIYAQIENSPFSFNLKDFLISLQVKNVDFYSLMRENEKKYYNNLPNCLKIYRGVNEKESNNKNYGISWSLSREEAINYIDFKPNKVDKGKGKLLTEVINKRDILTVFSVYENMKAPAKNEIIYLKKKNRHKTQIIQCLFKKFLNWIFSN